MCIKLSCNILIWIAQRARTDQILHGINYESLGSCFQNDALCVWLVSCSENQGQQPLRRDDCSQEPPPRGHSRSLHEENLGLTIQTYYIDTDNFSEDFFYH